MSNALKKTFRPRSYVGRNSRKTAAQSSAITRLWPTYGLANQKHAFVDVFKREAPVILEIGFGKGDSLLDLALSAPHLDFIGIETHEPGIGALLIEIEKHRLHNLRVMQGDAVNILADCIADNSLTGLQIFFPDPWPKRKHLLRRLVQTEFVLLAVSKLIENGLFHLATDWEDYAKQMMQVISQENTLINLNGITQFGERSAHRPRLTKFESRAIKEGRQIWDLQFQKNIV